MVALLAAAGCGSDAFQSPLASLQAASSSSGSSLSAGSPVIDAGIIFAGQTNYRCLPLAELGLDGVSSASDIAEITTSCQCVTANLVGYHDSPSQIAEALRLDFAPSKSSAGQHVPAHLAVEVTLQLKSGSTRALTVNVLETQSTAVAPMTVRSGP